MLPVVILCLAVFATLRGIKVVLHNRFNKRRDGMVLCFDNRFYAILTKHVRYHRSDACSMNF